MSIMDYNKTSYENKITVYNIKQLKKVVKDIEKCIKNVNFGEFEVILFVKYNDRDSNL